MQEQEQINSHEILHDEETRSEHDQINKDDTDETGSLSDDHDEVDKESDENDECNELEQGEIVQRNSFLIQISKGFAQCSSIAMLMASCLMFFGCGSLVSTLTTQNLLTSGQPLRGLPAEHADQDAHSMFKYTQNALSVIQEATARYCVLPAYVICLISLSLHMAGWLAYKLSI